MNISIGNGHFIQMRRDKYVIAKIDGHAWNAACEEWDAQYRVVREFNSYDEALNWSYRLGKHAGKSESEIEWEQRQIARMNGRDD
jgi:hypothetical protein